MPSCWNILTLTDDARIHEHKIQKDLYRLHYLSSKDSITYALQIIPIGVGELMTKIKKLIIKSTQTPWFMNVQLTDFYINAFNKFTHLLKCVQHAFHTIKTHHGVCRFPVMPNPIFNTHCLHYGISDTTHSSKSGSHGYYQNYLTDINNFEYRSW
jgi:hypothetical protein